MHTIDLHDAIGDGWAASYWTLSARVDGTDTETLLGRSTLGVVRGDHDMHEFHCAASTGSCPARPGGLSAQPCRTHARCEDILNPLAGSIPEKTCALYNCPTSIVSVPATAVCADGSSPTCAATASTVTPLTLETGTHTLTFGDTGDDGWEGGFWELQYKPPTKRLRPPGFKTGGHLTLGGGQPWAGHPRGSITSSGGTFSFDCTDDPQALDCRIRDEELCAEVIIPTQLDTPITGETTTDDAAAVNEHADLVTLAGAPYLEADCLTQGDGVCDEGRTCIYGTDKEDCKSSNAAVDGTRFTTMTCDGGVIIAAGQMCDGTMDCIQGTDEALCSFECDCSLNCAAEELGDGHCTPACNNELCGFDHGDCFECSPGCMLSERGNGVCNFECNTDACGKDLGDCADFEFCSQLCITGLPEGHDTRPVHDGHFIGMPGDKQCDLG